MEQLATVIVENGISLGSFIALIWFIFNDKKETNNIIKDISFNLGEIQKSLVLLNERVNDLEKRSK